MMERGHRPVIGAIADDLTGATDLALTLSHNGMRVLQTVGIPTEDTFASGADAIVVSLKSRTIAAAEAVAQSVAAGRALLAAGVQQLFFKYSSTFDSTDQGNIGPVIEALMSLTGETRTLVCPAFPRNSRTVYKGHLFVGDQLLSDSSMKNHPLTPMHDGNLVRVLGRQTNMPVSLIEITTVRKGAEALQAELDDVQGVAVVDALDDADLMTIGAAARNLRLITGGSGVAMSLPANFGFAERQATRGGTVPCGRAAVLAGSCSATTLRQIEMAKAAGMPGFRLDPLALAEGDTSPEDAIAFAAGTTDDDVPMFYSGAGVGAVRRAQEVLGRERAGAIVEDALGKIAAGLADRGFDRLLVAGGETSGAVISHLKVTTLWVGPEIDPGVPWMQTEHDGRPMALALKSGNFGADDIFLAAWNHLK
jgi:uncharacterized protein YgbK (DUF1537 family)